MCSIYTALFVRLRSIALMIFNYM